jgi:GMP synthase-like glutamine amidotransferase
MRAHCFQHVPFEGLGSIETWLHRNGWEITRTRFYADDNVPDPAKIDLLVVMGGPMSVNDEGEYPWLAAEKRFIRAFIDAGKAVLGVCLGAQLIASALGATVYRNHAREIGWFPMRRVPATDSSLFAFPEEIEVFHWHGETFDLPAGAALLAHSAACRHQAFQVGRSVIGLQFHLETSPATAREIVEQCREELVPAEYVQGEETILAAGEDRYRRINDLMDEVLSYLTR